MTNSNELYRHYKKSRKQDSQGANPELQSNRETGIASADEVESLYQAFRQNRDPDFENAIARVMQVAREKIEAEKAINNIMESADVQVAISSDPVVSKPGAFKKLLHLPSRVLDSIATLFSNAGSPYWIRYIIPAVAIMVIVAGVLSYEGLSPDTSDFDLAFVDTGSSTAHTKGVSDSSVEVAVALSQYVDTAAGTHLGFSGGPSNENRAFLLGAASVDLQIATLAEKKTLIEQSIVQLSQLISQEQNK